MTETCCLKTCLKEDGLKEVYWKEVCWKEDEEFQKKDTEADCLMDFVLVNLRYDPS